MGTLDDSLKLDNEKKKKLKKETDELNKILKEKHAAFKYKYKKLVNSIITPSMNNGIKSLVESGHPVKRLEQTLKSKSHLDGIGYNIQIQRNSTYDLIFYCDVYTEKVGVQIIYHINITTTKKNSVLLYDISSISDEFIEKLLAENLTI